MLTRHLTKRCSGVVAIIIKISLIGSLANCHNTFAAAAENLYRAQTIVTGQGEVNRIIGFAACLEDVLIKVSGALKLEGDPRLNAYQSRSADFVSAYSYHDQMSGTPKRDEQGTRDRPYDLIVDFDPVKIDAVLAALSLKPWLVRRPVLAVFVEMEQGTRKYIVTSDEKQSDMQRESLLAAASKRGIAIVLPSAALLAKAGVAMEEVSAIAPAAVAAVAAGQGGELALIGHLVWSDQELGWTTVWQLDAQGRLHRWQLKGVTFDEAFRRGLGGAAQILSGNGDPE